LAPEDKGWDDPDWSDLNAEAFEKNWMDWLDDPPVDWSPPKGANKVYTSTLDMRDRGGFVMRYDAWVGEQGIHVHTRVVCIVPYPVRHIHHGYAKTRRPAWAFWRKPIWHKVHEEITHTTGATSKNIVGSYVIPWSVLTLFEEMRFDPRHPPRPNGKGTIDE
jgi:hypothetical protein